MRNTKLFFFATFFIFAAISCKKDFSGQQEQKLKDVDPAKVFKTPSTPEEKLLVENLGKVTEVFKELYKDKSNLKVVNAAIFSKAYTDESVLLKDLIYPNSSRLNKVAKFNTFTLKWHVSLKKFSDNFWADVNKKNDPLFNQFLNRLNSPTNTDRNSANRILTIDNEEVSVYFPNSDEFVPIEGGSYEPIASITTATADADEGWGYLPYYANGVLQ